MVYKKKITKIKLNFHKPSKMKVSKASGIKHHKTNSPQSVVNAEKLPRVHVSLTRLMPTKMPHKAKEQYYKLVKSSALLSVTPAGKTSWNALSPEATPERESGKTSRISHMLSPITRIQLQSSPVDLDADYADLSNEPWSDSPEPYPSPKSPTNDENIESDGWFKSQPPINNSCPFEHEEDAELLYRNHCDKEVEAILARQDFEVPKDASDIPVLRPHPNKSQLQNIVIPLQPVGIGQSKLDTYRDDSPVFERSGIWTIPARNLSMEKTSGAVEKKGLKRKICSPKKQGETLDLTKSVDLNCSNDEDRSSSPITSGDQPSEQENAEDHERKCEKGDCRNVTNLVAKKRSVKKRIVEKGGRPRKRRRLQSVETPALSNPVGCNSNDSAKITLIRESSEQREIKDKEETSQSKGGKSKAIVSPVILKTNVGINISQQRSKIATDVREQKITLNAEDCLDPRIVDQGSETPHQQAPVLIEIDSSSSGGSDLHSNSEVRFERISLEDDDQITETTATPLKTRKWLSAVKIEKSPFIKSLELDKKQNVVKSSPNATVFLQDQDEKRQVRETKATPHKDSDWLGAVKIEKSPLIKSLELDKKQNVVKKSPNATVFLQDQDEKRQVRETKATPHKDSDWLGAVKIEKSPLIKSLELDKKQNGVKSPPNATVFLLDQDEKRQVRETTATPLNNSKWLSTVKIEKSPLIKSLELDKKQNGVKSPPYATVFLQDQDEKHQVRETAASPQRISKWLGSVKIETSPLIKTLELDTKQNGVNSRKTTVFLQDQEEKRQVRETTASPHKNSKWLAAVKIEKSPLIKSLELDTKQNGPPKTTVVLQDPDEKRQVRETAASPQRISKWLGAVKIETSPLIKTLELDKKQNGVNSPKATIFLQKEKRRTNQLDRLMSSRQELFPDKCTSEPGICLKPLEIRLSTCDRVNAGNYNALKSPENLPAKRPKPKRKRQKVNSEKKAMDKKEKGGKTRTKRKRENDSDKKPRKKRKLGIPDHYKCYKPCQLPTISHTSMRYRVAFDLWPQKFSGALDRINQRLINQNSFWKSLG